MRRIAFCLGVLLFLVGAVPFAGAVQSVAKSIVGEILVERAWYISLAKGEAVRPWPWADFEPIAQFDFPRIGKRAVALDSASGLGMSWGIGHVDGTAEPGAPGLSAFGGHRDSHFAFLQQVKADDKIILKTRDGIRRAYRVTGAYVVDSSQWRFPAATSEGVSRLAFSTCWPFDAQEEGDSRFILIAEEASADPPVGGGAPVSSTQPQPGGRAERPGSPARPL